MDPEPPVPGLGHHAMLSELPDEAIDAFVGGAGPESGSPLLLAELRHLGGALGAAAENAGALDKLDAEFAMLGLGMLMDPAMREPIEGQLDKLSMRWSRGPRRAATSTTPSDPATSTRSCPPETCKRLCAGEAQLGPRRPASSRTTVHSAGDRATGSRPGVP